MAKFIALIAKTAFVVLATLGAIIISLIFIGWMFWTPPSDKKMVRLFNDHRIVFDKIVELCLEDGNGHVPGSAYNVNRDKAHLYEPLFKESKIVTGVTCSERTAKLHAHSSGLTISSREKFYVYNPIGDYDTFLIVNSLEDKLEFDETTGSTRALLHIDGLWYLAYFGT